MPQNAHCLFSILHPIAYVVPPHVCFCIPISAPTHLCPYPCPCRSVYLLLCLTATAHKAFSLPVIHRVSHASRPCSVLLTATDWKSWLSATVVWIPKEEEHCRCSCAGLFISINLSISFLEPQILLQRCEKGLQVSGVCFPALLLGEQMCWVWGQSSVPWLRISAMALAASPLLSLEKICQPRLTLLAPSYKEVLMTF